MNDNLKGRWGTEVKALLDDLCQRNDPIVEAVIDSEKNALIYLDNEVMIKYA